MKRPSMFVGMATVALSITAAGSASAYCVYNDSDHEIGVLSLPITTSSFKENIPAHESRCCHWSNNDCVTVPGHFAETSFALFSGRINTGLVTANAVIWGINQLIAGMIPVVGSLTSAGVGQVKGLILAAIGKSPDIGIVGTYNGGVITYDGSEALGCWEGTCQGQDINYDGSRGIIR